MAAALFYVIELLAATAPILEQGGLRPPPYPTSSSGYMYCLATHLSVDNCLFNVKLGHDELLILSTYMWYR
jgi:hypothetical protein